MPGLHPNPLDQVQRNLHSDLLIQYLCRTETPPRVNVPAGADAQLTRLLRTIQALRRAREHRTPKMLPSLRS
jgi:hypothetical protein